MTSEQELQVAGWVGEVVQREYGVPAGPPTERDGRDDSGLTNDFTFDGADPPYAVEVTRLRDDFEEPSADEQAALEARLRRFADEREWLHWTVGIRQETKIRSDLEPAIRQLIEWMLAAKLEALGPGTYTNDVQPDLLYRMGSRFMHDCDLARMAGVILITRNAANGLRVITVAESSDSRSLQRPLARAFDRKTASLAKAKKRGYVTMLAVDVEREDSVGYVSEGTRAPGFPPVIDHLWLFFRGPSRVFHARRDDRQLRELVFPS
jgi:hypothetical protein